MENRIDTFEGGRALRFGLFTLLDLHGTWKEMGRQYGALASPQLCDMYTRAVEERVLAGGHRSREAAESMAADFFQNYPHRLSQILQGMAETSGLDMARHLLLNAVEVISLEELWRSEALRPGCTSIAVWGEYSSGPLIFGRNFDYLPWFRDLGENIVIAVYHPADGSLATATIGYAGLIYMTTGVNERGLFLELNNGEPSGGALTYNNRIHAACELFLFMLDSPDLDQLESFFHSTRSNFAYIVGTADDQTARCFEWPVFDLKRRHSVRRPGLMVATNHFTEPSWGLPRPDDAKFAWTRSRRQNLLNLAEHFKGSIDVPRMKKILGTRLEDLGATTDSTVYQVVAVPGSLSLSLCVPGKSDWTDIPVVDFLR